MTLEQRRAFHLAIMAFKYANNLAPTYLSIMFEPIELRHGMNTRAVSNRDMVVRQSRTRAGDRAFQHAGPAAWNALPADVRAATTIIEFKREYFTAYLTPIIEN